MARSVGPELDDLQRLLRRLQLDEAEPGSRSGSAARNVRPVGGRDQAVRDLVKDAQGGSGKSDSVQTTLAELVELRAPRNELTPRAEALQPVALELQAGQASGEVEHATFRISASIIAGVMLATVVSTAASVGLMWTLLQNRTPVAETRSEQPATPPAAHEPRATAAPTLEPGATAPPVAPGASQQANLEQPQSVPLSGQAGDAVPPQSRAPAASGPASQATSAPATATPAAEAKVAAADAAPVRAGKPELPPQVVSPPPPLKAPPVWVAVAGVRTPLPFVVNTGGGAAAQVLISGLEAGAAIGNGLEILPGTWLVEQVDLEGSWLERGDNPKAKANLDVQLRSLTGQLIARQIVVLTTDPSAAPQ